MYDNAIVAVVDMQYDFIRNAPDEFTSELVPAIHRALIAARNQGLPVIHIITEYEKDKSNWPAAWRERDSLWCMRGSRGAQIIESLEPRRGEEVFRKTRFSGFYETDLEAWLFKNSVREIGLMGYSADACVRFTAVDAYNRGFAVTILEDCVLSERETLSQSLDYLRWLTNCRVTAAVSWLAGETEM